MRSRLQDGAERRLLTTAAAAVGRSPDERSEIRIGLAKISTPETVAARPRISLRFIRATKLRHHQCQALRGAGDAGVEPAVAAVGEGEALVEQHDVVPLRALRLVH